MARARNIKPGFFTNADLVECDPLARLLFIGLWCEADPRGILEDRPKTLKIKILPGDNCDVDALLAELVAHGFIERYEVNGQRCIIIATFGKHQHPHQNEQNNSLPAPEQHESPPVQAREPHQSNREESLLPITDSLKAAASASTARAGASPAPAPAKKPPPPLAQSLYADTLDGALPKLESLFQDVDKQFNAGWLAKELAAAAAVVGPLSRKQLGEGLNLALAQLKRQMDAGKVTSPRPFAHRLIVDFLTEQRDEHHAA